MAPPRIYQTEAVILRQTNLGEADRIISLYTPNLGKVRAVAKGARRPQSKLAGHLQPLHHSLLLLTRGQNLDIITQAQTINSFLTSRSDLWLAGCAIYAVELVDRFTAEHIENHSLFDLLLNTLRWLDKGHPADVTLRYFEMQLLFCLGYRPQLHSCLVCQAPLKPAANFFSSSVGGVICPQCRTAEALARPISANALKLLRLLEKGDYTQVEQLKLSQELLSELEYLLRGYLRYLLDGEVKSVGFLDRLRREGANQPGAG